VRPFLHLSYLLNVYVSGQEDTFSFHLWNVLLHFGNSVLLFFSLRKLLAMAGEEESRARLLAAFGAAVFLVHPVHTEAVAYIAGRSESFSLLWFLSAYLLFLHRREQGLGWLASLGTLVLFGAAVLSKEHTAVLPALFVLTDGYFAKDGVLAALRRNWRLYAPMMAIGAAGVAMVWRVLTQATTAGFGMKDLPWHDYFYTQWRAIWIYLKLAVFPVGLNADYFIPISRSPLDHGAILGLLGLLGLLGTAVYFRRRFPLVFFGALVFFLLLAPTSSFVPIKDPVAERRLYLPFLGLLLALCDFLRRWKASPTLRYAGMGFVLAALAVGTHQRSEVWSDPYRLWSDTVAKGPDNGRAQFQLAMVHYTRGECDLALDRFALADRTEMKRDYSLYLDWGLAYDCLNDHAKAEEKFRKALTMAKDESSANRAHVRALIGMALARQNKLGAALEELNAAAETDPNYDMTYVYRGKVYLVMNELDRAEAEYRKALAVKPDSAAARQALAELSQRRGAAR
jgi:protein O-mannosyl-transferase